MGIAADGEWPVVRGERDGGGGGPTWVDVDARLRALAQAQREADHAQGRLLLAARRLAVHAELGLGSFSEYAERLFGFSPRQLAERLRVATALEKLPRLDAAVAGGELTWSAVRELTRVADADTEQAWLAAADGRTVREVERLVANRLPGQLPTDAESPSPGVHHLRLELPADVLALYREAIYQIRQQAGEKLAEEEAFALLVRQALTGAPVDGEAPCEAPGDASYQVAITVCARCDQGFVETGGELVAVDDEVTERALCDAEHIGCVDGSVGADGDDGAPVGSGEPAIPRKPPRATRSVPPSVRRAVLRRQRGRCVVPGCSCRVHEVHHLRYPVGRACSEDDVVGLCAAHHARVHEGRLLLGGAPSTGLSFRHVDGRPYGSPPAGPLLAVREQVQAALVHLGFRVAAVREVLARLCPHVGPAPEVDALLRASLAALVP